MDAKKRRFLTEVLGHKLADEAEAAALAETRLLEEDGVSYKDLGVAGALQLLVAAKARGALGERDKASQPSGSGPAQAYVSQLRHLVTAPPPSGAKAVAGRKASAKTLTQELQESHHPAAALARDLVGAAGGGS
jgi:hypothetical protein